VTTPIQTFDTICREALSVARGHAVTAALVASLVPIGAMLPSGSAGAATEGPDYSSRVDATVTPQGNAYSYEFKVVNTTNSGSGAGGEFIIVDWELPLFSANDVVSGSISAPAGWAYELIHPDDTTQTYNNAEGPYGLYQWDYEAANDPLLNTTPDLYGPSPGVFDTPPWIIHWYLTPKCQATESATGLNTGLVCEVYDLSGGIWEGNSLTGFGFTSAYSAGNAPYLSSWASLPPVSGDPPIPQQGLGSPNSPARQEAQGIPAPGALALILAGLAGLGLTHRRGRRHCA